MQSNQIKITSNKQFKAWLDPWIVDLRSLFSKFIIISILDFIDKMVAMTTKRVNENNLEMNFCPFLKLRIF